MHALHVSTFFTEKKSLQIHKRKAPIHTYHICCPLNLVLVAANMNTDPNSISLLNVTYNTTCNYVFVIDNGQNEKKIFYYPLSYKHTTSICICICNIYQ